MTNYEYMKTLSLEQMTKFLKDNAAKILVLAKSGQLLDLNPVEEWLNKEYKA